MMPGVAFSTSSQLLWSKFKTSSIARRCCLCPSGPQPVSAHSDRPRIRTDVRAGTQNTSKRPRIPLPPNSSTERTVSAPDSKPSLPVSLALLNLTTVLWGTQHAVIKLGLEGTPPSTLNFARFLLAALVSLPALRSLRFPQPRNILKTPVIRHGLELSLYLFAGYALQSAALVTTSASRSAFLLYLNVKLVPFFARILYARPIPLSVWSSAFIALSGTVLLTYDGSPPAAGDAFSVAAAAASALFILRTEAAAQSDAVPPAQLNAVTLTSVAILMGLWTAFDGLSQSSTLMLHQWSFNDLTHFLSTFVPTAPQSVAAVAYLAVVTTALCNYIQAVGQRGVSAERAAIVFALDPVYGAMFAWLLLGESLGTQGFIGAGCIFVATILSALADGPKKLGHSDKAKAHKNEIQRSQNSTLKHDVATCTGSKRNVSSPSTVKVHVQHGRGDELDR